MSKQSAAIGLRRVSWGAVLFVVGVVPLVTSNPTMLGLGRYPFTHDQIELPRAVLIQLATWLALGCWALAGWLQESKVKTHRAFFALAAFLAVATLSTAASPFRFTSLFGDYRHYEGLFQFFAYAGLCFVTMQLVNPNRLVWLARLMASVGLVLSSYGVAQAIWRDPANWLSGEMPGRRAFSTWGNPDFFGGYLVFPIAFALATMLADDNPKWRAVGLVSTLVSLFALVATNTRGAWLAGAAVAVIMLVGYARKGYAWKRLALLAGVALVASGWVLNTTSKGFVLMRVATAFASDDSGLAARINLWRVLLILVRQAPILGTGPDTIVPAAIRYFGYPATNDAHNYLLHIALGSGVVAAAVLFAFFAWVAFASAKSAFSPRQGIGPLALTAAWAASAGYLLHLMAGLSMITSTSLLFICVGALLASVSQSHWTFSRAVSLVVATAAGIALVAALAIGIRAVEADHAFFRARQAARMGGERLERAETAVRLHPYNARYREELESARSAED